MFFLQEVALLSCQLLARIRRMREINTGGACELPRCQSGRTSELWDSSEFEGYLYGDTEVSFLLVDMQPGEGVRLHQHPYAESLRARK